MEVKMKTVTPQAEINIVEIARVSSSRENKTEKPEGLINYLIKNSHWSPFEHAHMTVEIVTSKAIGIQLLRHRSFTFQEFSQRYAEVTGWEQVELRRQASKNRQSSEEIFNPELPTNIALSDGSVVTIEESASSLIERAITNAFRLYEQLIAAGVAKECARMVLPMCTQTTIYMTGSIRSWIHFLAIRDDEHAQKEVQLIAREVKEIFKREFPIISKALNY